MELVLIHNRLENWKLTVTIEDAEIVIHRNNLMNSFKFKCIFLLSNLKFKMNNKQIY